METAACGLLISFEYNSKIREGDPLPSMSFIKYIHMGRKGLKMDDLIKAKFFKLSIKSFSK